MSSDINRFEGTNAMKIKSIVVAVLIIAAIVLTLLVIDRSKGYIVVETDGAELELTGGLFTSLTVRSGGEPLEIPAKSYTPRRIRLTAKKDNDTWQLDSVGPWGELAGFRVEGGKTTTLQFGPPFKIKPQTSVNDRNVRVNLAIFGKAGERYRNVVLKNGNRVTAPQVKIIDQDGKVLVSGRFQYG